MRYPEAAKIRELEHDNAELRALFDLQHKRTLEADKLWQKAHNKPGVWPDLGELIQWLMKKAIQVRCCRNCQYGPDEKTVRDYTRCAGCAYSMIDPAEGSDLWEERKA